MPLWLYIPACLIVPALWGVVMFRVFNAVDKKRTEGAEPEAPPIDYSI